MRRKLFKSFHGKSLGAGRWPKLSDSVRFWPEIVTDWLAHWPDFASMYGQNSVQPLGMSVEIA